MKAKYGRVRTPAVWIVIPFSKLIPHEDGVVPRQILFWLWTVPFLPSTDFCNSIEYAIEYSKKKKSVLFS